MMAVYAIINKETHMKYIGSTVKYPARIHSHFSDLRTGRHYNPLLLKDAQKYGLDSFCVIMLERVEDKSILFEREQAWIDKYDFDKELYNISPRAGGTLGPTWLGYVKWKKTAMAEWAGDAIENDPTQKLYALLESVAIEHGFMDGMGNVAKFEKFCHDLSASGALTIDVEKHQSAVTEIHEQRAYRILKRMAVESGHMTNDRCLSEYDNFCTVLEDAAIVQSRDAELTFPFVTVAVPIAE